MTDAQWAIGPPSAKDLAQFSSSALQVRDDGGLADVAMASEEGLDGHRSVNDPAVECRIRRKLAYGARTHASG
jgi:hypothetical protein